MTISPDICVDDGQKAEIEKYGFDCASDGMSHFLLTDPAAKAKKKGLKWSHVGGNLDVLLEDAVAIRKGFDPNGKFNTGAKAEVQPEPEAPKPETITVQPDETVTVRILPDEAPKPAPKRTRVQDEASDLETNPPTEIEGAELDDTGKRVKPAKKVKEPKVRKDNRYLRGAKVIVNNLTITDKALSSQAAFSIPTANHVLEAWVGITSVLISKGWISKAQAAEIQAGYPTKK
jgi:hypothetical protein